MLMEKKDSLKEPSEKFARESLIAISHGSIDLSVPKNITKEKVAEPGIRDGDEKYRSMLISISSSPPPDVKVLPFVRGQPGP